MSASHNFRRFREPSRVLLMCLLVCFCGWASAQLSLAVGTASGIWITNGVISAFVLTAPKRWRNVFFVAGQLANLGTDVALGDALPPACWFAVCNALEVLVSVLGLRHLEGRAEVATPRTAAGMTLCSFFLGPLICAVLAGPVAGILDRRPSLEAIRIWFMADALGCAATLPLMLFLLTRETNGPRPKRVRAGDIAWASVLVLAALAIFSQTRFPLIFMLFPPLVATLFRFRLSGAVYGCSFVVMLAAAFTAEGHGPFALFPGTAPAERVLMFQMFGFVVFGSCVPLGFSIEERYRLEENLKKANRRLEDLAFLDPLTGVRNRRSFDADMASEWSRASVSGEYLSLLFLDIDFFKRFNDGYGHQRGDECLRSVAAVLAVNVRESIDVVMRYGGEEFVILLPGTDADTARATADRIALAIEELRIPHKDSPFGIVTVSFGIATVRPRQGGNPEILMRRADDALYTAKRAGRHRIETVRETEPDLHLQT